MVAATRRCSCGCLVAFYPVASSGKMMPIEADSTHSTWRPGDWAIGDDGLVRPGAPMFDVAFVRPHWEGCPDAERWRMDDAG